MKEKMKQNKNYSVLIRIASATLASLVLFFSLCVPSFADNSQDNFGPIGQSKGEFIIGVRDGNNMSAWSSNTSVYMFAYKGSHMPELERVFVSDNHATVYYTQSAYMDNSLSLSLDSTLEKYISNSTWSNSSLYSSITVPVFDSFEEGYEALEDFLNPAPAVTPHDINITLPAGNAIFIQYSSSSTGSISTYFNQAHGSPYSGSNQTMSYVDSIPSSFTSIGSPINWVGNGKTDILGRYRNFTCNLIPNPNHSYLVIVNPYFNTDYVDVEHEDANYEISIHMTNVINAQFVALTSSVVSGSVSNSSSDQKYYTEYDDSTNTWVTKDENGNPASPTPGGTILPVTSNNINDWLQNISNQIAGFFKGAIGAVTTLVEAGSSFFNVLVGLYSWLPPAVFSVLSSALIVIITIGVIKVFI